MNAGHFISVNSPGELVERADRCLARFVLTAFPERFQLDEHARPEKRARRVARRVARRETLCARE